MLEINEIFGPSIQGEGKYSGVPSIFIRFSRCNLRCRNFGVKYRKPDGSIDYLCDTYYAVDPVFKNDWMKYESAGDLIREVDKLVPLEYKPHIVITGGEPLLNWKDKQFQKLLKHYIKNKFQITIETNATIDIKFTKKYQKKILFSMGVKLANCGEPLEKRVRIKAISNIIKKTKNSYLKFVIDKNFVFDTQKEIEDILKTLPKTKVYLMPLGDCKQNLEQNVKTTVNLAVEKGFLYSDRLHIRIWDNKKGV